MRERPREEPFDMPSSSYPGQPYSSPYSATPPPPPRRNKRSFLGWGCVSIFGLALVTSISAAIGSQHPNTSASGTTTAPASDAAAPASSAASQPPVVKLDLSGNGTQNSASFTTGPNWSIAYTFDCSNFSDGTGNFQIFVYTDGGLPDAPVNELSRGGNSTTYEHDNPGSHYLTMNSECPWTVKVTDGVSQ